MISKKASKKAQKAPNFFSRFSESEMFSMWGLTDTSTESHFQYSKNQLISYIFLAFQIVNGLHSKDFNYTSTSSRFLMYYYDVLLKHFMQWSEQFLPQSY
jgi:hypothetical protein